MLGDFNSHSDRWGYDHTDSRGDEVEDWEIDNNLYLINRADDPPTFYSRRWLTTSTPDLGFTTYDLAPKIERSVLPQLAGSDHKPIKLSLQLNSAPPTTNPLPRWNYKRANWESFRAMTDQLCNINTHHKKVNKMYTEFNAAVLKSAKATIPRGARRNYRPYWTEELQRLEDEVSSAREVAEEKQDIAANIRLKEASAKLRRLTNETARKSWGAKTESLNYEKDGNKLWKLVRQMNDENCSAPAIVIENNNRKCTGKQAADVFIKTYHNISKVHIPKTRKEDVLKETKLLQDVPTVPEENMTSPLTSAELEKAVLSLKKNKSPGRDAITNEMIQHLGTKARSVLLKILNKSWKEGTVPQTWKEATMVPIHKKGKGKQDPHNYRPISLLSCVGKVMEKMVNNRLLWHLESKGLLSPEQAGFRQHRSTEDQVTYIAQEIEDTFQGKQHAVAVWVDLEKAFDKVWKDGLKLKLLRSGVTGNMYKWIDSYLSERSGRVHLQGHLSRKLKIEQGVPQGGVLSPTLFLIYINDMARGLNKNVSKALYADDLALWSKADSSATAGVRVQQALHTLENWTKDWLLSVNERKTTFTVFTLSTKQKIPKLLWNNHPLVHDETPTYLGITLDQRLTWKKLTKKCQTRAKLRLGLMKKLAGTSWGCDEKILKKVYQGRIRPVLEYGMASWTTTAPSNFDNICRAQNQALRIMTGGMRSTPIKEMESICKLPPTQDRRDMKTLSQFEKFKRLEDHPMHCRVHNIAKGRLKRSSMVRKAKEMVTKIPALKEGEPTALTLPSTSPCHQSHLPELKDQIPGIIFKELQPATHRRAIAVEFIEEKYPLSLWTHVYTDGSAENATEKGGAGFYITLKDGTETRDSSATGRFCNNYSAEAEALRLALQKLREHTDNIQPNIVFLTDCRSLIQAIGTGKAEECKDLVANFSHLMVSSKRVVVQWIPSHCGIRGNEIADQLAKIGSEQIQDDLSVSYKSCKSNIRKTYLDKWRADHPGHKDNDAWHYLERQDQVTIFRLRTGHNKLQSHMFHRFRVGDSPLCPCGSEPMTATHILQQCQLLVTTRAHFWPTSTPLDVKLWGSLEELQKTAHFIRTTRIDVSRENEKKKKKKVQCI